MKNATELKYFSESREEKARRILEVGKPIFLDDNTYLVPSQFDSNKKYEVTHFDTFMCDCPDFLHHCKGKGLYCKHIKAILLFTKIKNAYEVEPLKQELELVIETPKKECCPYCSHEEIFKRGTRKTTTGIKQLYCCKSCNKRFVQEPISHIKGNAKLVCLAMDCYYKGLSYRDIADQFKQFYGLNISHVTIRTWVLKFSQAIENYTQNIKVKAKGDWNADETLILTKRGKDEHNGNLDYVWNVIDNKTKFLLASVNSGRKRGSKEAVKVFTEAWEQNENMPNRIITDKLPSYQDGVRKTFRNWGNERKVKHVSILGRRRYINNNVIEGHHSQQKEFHKVRRGVNEVQAYADGFKVFHNFIRKDVKNKTTPAEKCGIGIEGQNRWYPLLVNSVKKATNLTSEEKDNESH